MRNLPEISGSSSSRSGVGVGRFVVEGVRDRSPAEANVGGGERLRRMFQLNPLKLRNSSHSSAIGIGIGIAIAIGGRTRQWAGEM